MSEKRRSRRSEHKWGQLRIVNSVLLIFLCITAIWATYTILANNILAFRYVNVLYAPTVDGSWEEGGNLYVSPYDQYP